MKKEEDIEKQIKDIIGCLKCQKDFKCYKSGFKNLCKAEDIGMATFIKCLEEKPQKCKFARPFGYSWYCNCPLRTYIIKNIKELECDNKK